VSVQAEQETLSFQAEAVQVLDLVINSLYSNKEIFLRELISNASDAIDRLRLELLSAGQTPGEDEPPRIEVAYDRDAGTITLSDNGIGMSRAEVIEHIGTIAKSGTREFLRALTGDQRKDATLIGQFGVGFYSAFIVAERVTLVTRRHGRPAAEGVRWESDGKGEYTLETVERPDHGTTITLQLRPGEDDLLDGHRLRSIIRKYSDHISVPIMLADPGEQAAESPVNQASALWTRPKSEISDKEYRDFYRHIARLGAQQGRGNLRIHAAAVPSGPCPLRPVDPAGRPRRETAHPAGFRYGRQRPAAADVPALRPRCRRLERSSAERIKGTAAE
jgi:molecular chaperone HtpG